MIRRVEDELLRGARWNNNLLAQLDGLVLEAVGLDADADLRIDRLRRCVLAMESHLHFGGIVCRAERREAGGIAHGYCARSLKPDMLPDAHVPVAGCGNPIPADAAVLGNIAQDLGVAAIRPVDSHQAAQLLVHRVTREIEGMNPDSDGIGALAMNHVRNIEAESLEHSGHVFVVAHLLAVDPNVSAVIDAVKMQPHHLALEIGGQVELTSEPVRLGPWIFKVGKMAVLIEPIPFVLFLAGVGNEHIVQADIWIGINNMLISDACKEQNERYRLDK